jgi:ABC-type sugar transport system substrate-binding protein
MATLTEVGSRRCRRARVVRAVAAGLAVSLGVAASPAAAKRGVGHGSHFRFAWLANDPGNEYDNAILAGIRAEAEKSKSTVDPYFAGFDPATQLAQCQEAVASGLYDGLIVIPASPTDILPCVTQARAAGVAVAAVDLPIGPDTTTFEPQVPGVVASSLVPAADYAAKFGAFVPEACAGLDPCDVFYLAGLTAFEQPVIDAVAAAAAADPSISFVGYAEGFYDAGLAHDIMTQVLADHPEIDVVMTSDQMAFGTEQAMTEAGVTLRLVGAGAGADAIQAVRDGRFLATLNTLPFTEGRLVTELLVRALRIRHAAPAGVNPIVESGLPDWWTLATLAAHPDFQAEWPVP